jgi:hypothetical protein
MGRLRPSPSRLEHDRLLHLVVVVSVQLENALIEYFRFAAFHPLPPQLERVEDHQPRVGAAGLPSYTAEDVLVGDLELLLLLDQLESQRLGARPAMTQSP